MNIQIYAAKKNFETQKAERYFKERKITYQLVDLGKKNLSKGELQVIKNAVGLKAIIDITSRDYQTYSMAYHGTTPLAEELLLAHAGLLKTPIVRNGKQATVGFCPEIWEVWE
ncbi:MAG: ArsC family transcriptional regulator [Eubacteriales bacterium]|nr:ArsC family transcriptional regulator [Eubacteriales bacterium]